MITLIFILGYLTMVLNEGFVILRHLSKKMAKKREKLIKKYGKKWQIFHSAMDIVWVSFVSIGIIFSEYRWFFLGLVLGFWLIVLVVVYLPKLFKMRAKFRPDEE